MTGTKPRLPYPLDRLPSEEQMQEFGRALRKVGEALADGFAEAMRKAPKP